jgi:hypothetical protein
MSTTREFTESWLQALTLSANIDAARRIRPWMTILTALGSSEVLPDQRAGAEQTWRYAYENGLLGLLSILPFRQSEWRFEEDEVFAFRHAHETQGGAAGPLKNVDEFIQTLAIEPISVPMLASVTSGDWTNLIRKEAVRRSKPLSVMAIPPGSRVEVPCSARWDGRQWSMAFAQPEWLVVEQPGVFHATRPVQDVLDSAMVDALDFANKSLMPTIKLSNFVAIDAAWMGCIEPLYPWHRSVLLSNELGVSPWLRRVWNNVWPVIYRERNKLRGPCDLSKLRTELAECFSSAPQLTEWMFVFARLVCEVQWGRGLGIAGDFTDA